LGLLGRDDFARGLPPVGVAPRVIADETRIGAVLAHHVDLRLFRKCIFKPVGEPIRVRVAKDNDRDRRLGPLLRGRGGMGGIPARVAIPGALASPSALTVLIAVAGKAAKPLPEGIVALDALWPPPIPELRLGRRQKGQAQTDSGKRRQAFGCEMHSHSANMTPPECRPVPGASFKALISRRKCQVEDARWVYWAPA